MKPLRNSFITDVVTIGSANVDLVARVNRFPVADDEVVIDDLKTLAGGSAANVAVGVARLGYKSTFIGLIGTDYFGNFLIDEFKKEGVDTSHIERIEGSSGIVFAAVNKKCERVMYSSEGIGSLFSTEYIQDDCLKSARFIHLSNIAANGALEAFQLVAKKAKENGSRVIFDPGCIFAEEDLETLSALLRHCYIVKSNKLEAKMMTGTEGEEAARKILETGVENVIITEGLDGCIVGNRDKIKRIPLMPKRKIKVVDLTGAGDSFAAGLLVALLKNIPLDDAVEFAMQIGSLSTENEGGRGTPKFEDLPDQIRI